MIRREMIVRISGFNHLCLIDILNDHLIFITDLMNYEHGKQARDIHLVRYHMSLLETSNAGIVLVQIENITQNPRAWRYDALLAHEHSKPNS